MDDKLRLRMKVWRDPQSGEAFMVSNGVGTENSAGEFRVVGFLMSERITRQAFFTADEWNALPFYWFQEDGEAPRRKEPFKPIHHDLSRRERSSRE